MVMDFCRSDSPQPAILFSWPHKGVQPELQTTVVTSGSTLTLWRSAMTVAHSAISRTVLDKSQYVFFEHYIYRIFDIKMSFYNNTLFYVP